MLVDTYGFACSGDHTVKVICVRTGKCLQTLTGHRRTPWVVSPMTSVLWQQQHVAKCATVQSLAVCAVWHPSLNLSAIIRIASPPSKSSACPYYPSLLQVRFHPSSSSLLASGSLDYEVRLWNAHTAECINVHNFGGCPRLPDSPKPQNWF